MSKESQIVDAWARLIRIPVEPRGDAIQKFTSLELPFVWIRNREGVEGCGFGYTIGKGGRAALQLLKSELLPLLQGEDASYIVELSDRLRKSIHALTPGVLSGISLAAVDIALWDLQAKRLKMPLHVLLGGAKRSVPVYNTDVGWLDRPIDELVLLSRKAVEGGRFRALKLKVGKPDPQEDEQRVARVREAVGPKTRLMIDANQAWTVDEALRRLAVLEKYDITWIEEPLPAEDLQGYQTLGRFSKIPRAGGESLYSLGAFYEAVRLSALDILQPDVARVGGITNALRICHLAETAGLRVTPHVSPELSVTVASAVNNSFFIEFIPQMEPLLSETLRIEGGVAIPFDGPGHGIPISNSKLARYEENEDVPPTATAASY